MIWSTLKDWEIYCCVFGVMSWFIYAQQPMSEVNGNVYTILDWIVLGKLNCQEYWSELKSRTRKKCSPTMCYIQKCKGKWGSGSSSEQASKTSNSLQLKTLCENSGRLTTIQGRNPGKVCTQGNTRATIQATEPGLHFLGRSMTAKWWLMLIIRDRWLISSGVWSQRR